MIIIDWMMMMMVVCVFFCRRHGVWKVPTQETAVKRPLELLARGEGKPAGPVGTREGGLCFPGAKVPI
jgi:hypothetical protein